MTPRGQRSTARARGRALDARVYSSGCRKHPRSTTIFSTRLKHGQPLSFPSKCMPWEIHTLTWEETGPLGPQTANQGPRLCKKEHTDFSAPGQTPTKQTDHSQASRSDALVAWTARHGSDAQRLTPPPGTGRQEAYSRRDSAVAILAGAGRAAGSRTAVSCGKGCL